MKVFFNFLTSFHNLNSITEKIKLVILLFFYKQLEMFHSLKHIIIALFHFFDSTFRLLFLVCTTFQSVLACFSCSSDFSAVWIYRETNPTYRLNSPFLPLYITHHLHILSFSYTFGNMSSGEDKILH